MNFGEFHFNNIRTDTDNVLIADVSKPNGKTYCNTVIHSDFYKDMKYYHTTRKIHTELFERMNFPTFKLLIENQ